MLEKLLRRPAAIARRRAGILGPYLDSFLVAATELGYTISTLRTQLWVLGDLERWLKRKRLVLVALEEQVLKQFLEHQRRHGRLRRGDSRTVHRLLEHLRAKGVVPSPEPTVDHSPLAALGQRYEDYLRKERGLCPGTGARYWGFLRQFLVERFGRGPICLRKLVPDDVSSFVLRHARSGSPGVAKLMVTALRSFCRFLFRSGETKRDLAGALPTVATWRLAEVPRYLEPQEVERVIQACDREHCGRSPGLCTASAAGPPGAPRERSHRLGTGRYRLEGRCAHGAWEGTLSRPASASSRRRGSDRYLPPSRSPVLQHTARLHSESSPASGFRPSEFPQYHCLPRRAKSWAAAEPQGGASPTPLVGDGDAPSRGLPGRDRPDPPPPRCRTPRRSMRKSTCRASVPWLCRGPGREVGDEHSR